MTSIKKIGLYYNNGDIFMVKLKAKELFEFILILFLFEPNIFVKYRLLNVLFICGGIISFSYITILRLTHGRKFYKLTLLIIFWRILLILQTLSFNGDILKVGYQSMIIVALFLYGEYFYNTFYIFVIEFVAIFSFSKWNYR